MGKGINEQGNKMEQQRSIEIVVSYNYSGSLVLIIARANWTVIVQRSP